MPSINIDLAFFSNRKVGRLTDTLGSRAEIFLVRLWCYVGTHWPEIGGSDDWTAGEVERAAAWDGVKGELVRVLCEPATQFLHRRGNGYFIHDWEQHASHLIMYKEKASKAARARWERVKREREEALAPPHDAPSNASSMPQAMHNPCSSNANTMQCNAETHTQSACGNFEDSLSSTYESVVKAWRETSGVKSLDANTKQGARELAHAVDTGELPIGDVAAVIRNGLDDKGLPNQGLRGIARRFTRYLPKAKASNGPLTHVVEFVCDSCGHTEEQRLTKGNPLYPKLCKKNGCDGRMQPNVKEE